MKNLCWSGHPYMSKEASYRVGDKIHSTTGIATELLLDIK